MKRLVLALLAVVGLMLLAYAANELPVNDYGRAVWTLRVGSPRARTEALERLKARVDRSSTAIVAHALARDSNPLVRESAAAILGERVDPESCAALAASLERDGSEIVVFTAAGSLANHSSDCATAAFEIAAQRWNLLVVGGGFEYYLARPSQKHDDLLAAAFPKYGGVRMAKALKASGRRVLVRVVEEEEIATIKRAKVLTVGDGTEAERAILW